MGGNAFALASAEGHPRLQTPRMTPEIYHHLKVIYTNRLRSCFPDCAKIATLTEAPEKSDYGDIDFIISFSKKPASSAPDWSALANDIGAAGFIWHGPKTASFAVPQFGSMHPERAMRYHLQSDNLQDVHRSNQTPDTLYAQIDVELVEDELFDWHTFYASYGDMSSLLGHIVRNLGFTCSDRGLWLRLQELDDCKRQPIPFNIADKDGTIFLSHDKSQVMRFLNLDAEVYEKGFATRQELFEWLGKCRLIEWEAIDIRRDNADKKRREEKRGVFKAFLNEWLPANRPSATNSGTEANDSSDKHSPEPEDPKTSLVKRAKARTKLRTRRSELAEEAVTFFAKCEECACKHEAIVRNVRNAVASNILKDIVKQVTGKNDNKKLNEIIRAFKRFVRVRIPSVNHPVGNVQADTIAVFAGRDEGGGNVRIFLEISEEGHSDAESEVGMLLREQQVTDEEGRIETKYELLVQDAVTSWLAQHWEELKALERHKRRNVTETDGRT
ncbi:hypothetical protein D0869_01488 [Hortaea werneckii]|uniref:Uncharacterized protein n=1 Tax=Hortaea werneckii TaxID=91943 RepID=A0A3M6YVR6_HORWE|nr:hypothetical protein KC324_g15520 [Hortaea werneckii]KAI7539612.1 hypothetical protein KC316_g15666 [Hortaea werneckii]RMX88626.1 hypothetical protein D0869_01488 [Hortaea werneckii]RMY07113.1 hypothetical protein D0868_05522 [Hortaea werneckii]